MMDMELTAHDKSLAANHIIPRECCLFTTSSYSCISRRTVTALPLSSSLVNAVYLADTRTLTFLLQVIG
jgi:hypothetical protein